MTKARYDKPAIKWLSLDNGSDLLAGSNLLTIDGKQPTIPVNIDNNDDDGDGDPRAKEWGFDNTSLWDE